MRLAGRRRRRGHVGNRPFLPKLGLELGLARGGGADSSILPVLVQRYQEDYTDP